MRRLDPHDRLDIVASQQHGGLGDTGVTGDEAEVAAWTVAAWTVAGDGPDEPGRVKVGGARAIALALAVARGRAWPTWPWKVPGAPWVLDRAYALVAHNRHRLPGVTPWCVEHDGACGDAPGG